VCDRFAQVELDQRELKGLLDQQDIASSAPPGRPVKASWLQFGAVAAVVLTLISVWFTGQWYNVRESNRLMVAIAEEVAANHLKLKPLEIQGNELGTVFAYFGDLDFQLVQTPRLGRGDEALLGGRYCSIQGISAAQLRFQGADGRLSTWYEGTLPVDQLRLLPDPAANQPPAEFFVRGIRVHIWTEHGLVFAEARSAR